MTGDESSTHEIVRLLEGASDAKLLAVVRTIDQLASRGALEPLLQRFRPRLAQLRPPRPLTLRRVLSYPLEPALVDDEKWSPGIARVPRHHLHTIHDRVLGDLEAAFAHELRQAASSASSADSDVVLEVGERLWPAAAAVLDRAAKGDRSTGRRFRASFRVAADLLAIGPWLVPAIWRLPARPITQLDPSARFTMRELLARASERNFDCLMMVTDLLVEQCASPMLVLQPLFDGELAVSAHERARCASIVIERSLADLGSAVADARRSSTMSATEGAALVLRVVSYLESLADAPPELHFDQRAMRQLRAATAELAETIVERTLSSELVFTLQPRATKLSVASAEQAARALFCIRLVARQLRIATKIDHVFRRAEREFDHAFEALVTARGAGRTEPSAVDAELMDRLRIMEILFGSRRAIAAWRHCRERARAGGATAG